MLVSFVGAIGLFGEMQWSGVDYGDSIYIGSENANRKEMSKKHWTRQTCCRKITVEIS